MGDDGDSEPQRRASNPICVTKRKETSFPFGVCMYSMHISINVFVLLPVRAAHDSLLPCEIRERERGESERGTVADGWGRG